MFSQLIHGPMRMNVTLKRYMDGNMLHNWYTAIIVLDVSRNETNSCMFPT